MPHLIDQTRNAIADLRAAGLRRDEYRVKTPCVRGYYGDAQISILASRERQFTVLDALAQRFICHIVHRSGDFHFVCVSEAHGRPCKDFIDLDVNLDGVDVTTDAGYAAHRAFRAVPKTLSLA